MAAKKKKITKKPVKKKAKKGVKKGKADNKALPKEKKKVTAKTAKKRTCTKKLVKTGGRKRTEHQREMDRVLINELRLMGWKQWAIAQKINEGRDKDQQITQQTISQELANIKKDAQERIKQNHDAWLEEQLEQIDLVQREAWQSWLESHKEKTTETEIKRKGFRYDNGTETEKTTEQGKGEPRYLEIVLKCVKMRNELFGIEPPKVHQVIGDQALSDYLMNPDWIKYQQMLLRALDKFPEARAKLAEAMGKNAPTT